MKLRKEKKENRKEREDRIEREFLWEQLEYLHKTLEELISTAGTAPPWMLKEMMSIYDALEEAGRMVRYAEDKMAAIEAEERRKTDHRTRSLP